MKLNAAEKRIRARQKVELTLHGMDMALYMARVEEALRITYEVRDKVRRSFIPRRPVFLV